MVKSLFGDKPTMTVTDVSSLQPSFTTPTSSNLPMLKPITLNEVSDFGASAQRSIATVTDKITGIAKTSDMDDLGVLLQTTIKTAKGYDPASMQKSGFFGLFKAKFSDFKSRFDTVDQSVNSLIGQIDQRISLFRGRIQDLDVLQQNTRDAHIQLGKDIQTVLDRISWMESNKPAVDPNDAFSAQKLSDWNMVISLATKRASDMQNLQLLYEQQDAQITQMKQNSAGLAQKFGDLKATAIPALKSTFTLYVINMEQEKGAKVADSIDNLTNQAITDNAKKLGQNTTAIHTALTRSNISLDTLKTNHDAIMTSLSEVERIHSEMKLRLRNEAPQIEQLSRDLAARLSK